LAILFWFSKFGDVNSIFVFTSSAFVEIIIESKTSCVIIKHHLRITPLSTKKWHEKKRYGMRGNHLSGLSKLSVRNACHVT
jgi:hypothetical protein